MSRGLPAPARPGPHSQVPDRCLACHDWTATVLIDETGAVSRPEVCPMCGREVPIAQVIELAGISLEAI